MKYTEIIKPEIMDEYISYNKKIYNEMTNINADILLLEKIYALPIADLQLYSAWSLCALVTDNTLQNLSIKLYRLLWDNDGDVFTLTKYKNQIFRQYLKEEHKSWFQTQIREVEINEENINNLEDKVRRMRNNFLVHRNKKFFEGITDTVEISFSELKDLVFKLNEYYKVLSFEVEDKYTSDEYYDINIRRGTERAFSNNLDDCMLALILTSNLFNEKPDCAKYEISQLNNDNKVLLEKFKKRVLALNFITDCK